MPSLRGSFTATAAAVVLGTTVLAPPALATTRGGPADQGRVAADCFWFGPTPSLASRAQNYAYPDSGATYWAAMFTLPAGATLTFDGEYAHARYQSLNSYDVANHAPTDALNDVSTNPDAGSRNPYLPGARRAGEAHRSYTATVVGAQRPADAGARAANTLYAGVPGQPETVLLYRVYLPDRGRDATGGTGLPRPSLHLADGTTVTGRAACDAVQAQHRETLPLTSLSPDTYRALRDQPGRPVGFPAEATPVWHSFYNSAATIACVFQGQCGGTPAKSGGQYSNKDNEYVSAEVSRAYGNVLVLHGKLPTTPATVDRAPRMPAGTDLRYWSLCSNESMATTAAVACIDDEDLVTDRDGNYTVVLSLPQDRPRNATPANGVNWLSLSPEGDGAGHLDNSMLVLRNMLPSPAFGHAVQNTRVPGDERAVMGPYLPTGAYTTTESFEALGRRTG
ncbi:hypothetical protein [Streptomyces sp. TLI_171]|uniref:hypothetical protein n=1 Tax=Streptomyces sp. TLI_171 TaxID=1938859 RepID=UPI000C195CDD|nr:hypothetical protein [Streptomyces sp. TLI_171]RKE23640.1 hypothetical protein BX266_7126 [Streptomyces sp. TLI_171]